RCQWPASPSGSAARRLVRRGISRSFWATAWRCRPERPGTPKEKADLFAGRLLVGRVEGFGGTWGVTRRSNNA
ncbi:MAG: hypothetical protein E5X22_23685, partial [Mesorhizobium sp.]